MTRFMAPRYFEQDQHDAVVETLGQLKIGDDEGVRIFIIALEYELAEYTKYNSQPAGNTPPPVAEERVVAVAAAAEGFKRALQELSEKRQTLLLERLAADDLFARQYDARYLSSMVNEVTRISAACQTDQQQSPDSKNEPNEAKKRFIALVAEAYSECFETDPASQECKPFSRLLSRIIEISALDIDINLQGLEQIINNRADISAGV